MYLSVNAVTRCPSNWIKSVSIWANWLLSCRLSFPAKDSDSYAVCSPLTKVNLFRACILRALIL